MPPNEYDDEASSSLDGDAQQDETSFEASDSQSHQGTSHSNSQRRRSKISQRAQRKSPCDATGVDMFGERVSLKHKGRTRYTSRTGACVSVLFIMLIAWIASTKVRSLIIGKNLGYINTYQNVGQVQYELDQAFNATDLQLRVGFVKNRVLMSSDPHQGKAVAFTPQIGRFEFINVKQNRTQEETKIDRIELEPCSSNTTNGEADELFLCPPKELDMSIFGDSRSDNSSMWVLQFRSCQDYEYSKKLYTEEQESEWYATRKLNPQETIFAGDCHSNEDIDAFFLENMLSLFVNNTYVNGRPDLILTEGNLEEQREQVIHQQIHRQSSFVANLEVKQNIINYVFQDFALLSAELFEYYPSAFVSHVQDTSKPFATNTAFVDQTLTRGYSATIIIQKSRFFDKTSVTDYSFNQFIGELGGAIVGFYLVFWVLQRAVPLQRLADLELISQIYHMNPNETMSIKKLQPALRKSFHVKQSDNSLKTRMGAAMRQKFMQVVQNQMKSINSSLVFSQAFHNFAMKKNDKLHDQQSFMLYLSSALLRRPKFGKVGIKKLCRLKFSKDKRNKLKYKRIVQAEEKLDHDLDIRTHLRTISKTQGLVHSLLDDKQRLMLKYQKTRLITIGDKVEQQELQKQKAALSNSKEVSNIIYQRLTQPDAQLTPADFRMLQGLTRTWVLEEDKAAVMAKNAMYQRLAKVSKEMPNKSVGATALNSIDEEEDEEQPSIGIGSKKPMRAGSKDPNYISLIDEAKSPEQNNFKILHNTNYQNKSQTQTPAYDQQQPKILSPTISENKLHTQKGAKTDLEGYGHRESNETDHIKEMIEQMKLQEPSSDHSGAMMVRSNRSKLRQGDLENPPEEYKHQRSHTGVIRVAKRDKLHENRQDVNNRVIDDERDPDRTAVDESHNENAPIQISKDQRQSRDNGTFADELIKELNQEP